MKVCLQRRQDQTLVFADPSPGGLVFYGSHSSLYALSRGMNDKGIRNGWTARVRALIVGSARPSSEDRETAQSIVWRCNFYHYEMIVGDRFGIDETVVRECNRLGMKYQTFGTTVRPANGGKHYTRVVTPQPMSVRERDAARLSWMVSQADLIYTFIPLVGMNLRGKDVVTLCTATARD